MTDDSVRQNMKKVIGNLSPVAIPFMTDKRGNQMKKKNGIILLTCLSIGLMGTLLGGNMAGAEETEQVIPVTTQAPQTDIQEPGQTPAPEQTLAPGQTPEEPSQEIVVTFDGNGNGEEPYTKIMNPAQEELVEFDTPTYLGHEFKGWNTAADGSGDYFKNSTFVTESITLYAIWKAYPDGELNYEKGELFIGETLELKLKKATGEIKFKSSDESVAKVSKDGLVEAKKAGSCKIICTQYGKEYICKITVKKPDKNTAYGLFLSNFEKKHEGESSFMLKTLSSKDAPLLIVIDALPISITDKAQSGAASYFDEGKTITTKTISFYQYKDGKVYKIDEIKLSHGIYIYGSRFSSAKMRINQMTDKASKHIILTLSNWKVSKQYLDSYKGNEYRIVNVYRNSLYNRAKLFKYKK